MRRARYRLVNGKIRPDVWSCPNCGRPFLTEQQMLVHYLSCK